MMSLVWGEVNMGSRIVPKGMWRARIFWAMATASASADHSGRVKPPRLAVTRRIPASFLIPLPWRRVRRAAVTRSRPRAERPFIDVASFVEFVTGGRERRCSPEGLAPQRWIRFLLSWVLPKPRVAVIGAGSFGRHHLRVLSKSENAHLAGVVDVDAGRTAAAAAEFGCPVVGSLAELAGRADAAVVAVPTSAHAEVGCALLDAGIDVLVEKPIAGDLESARRLVDAAKRGGRIFGMGAFEGVNRASEGG